MQFGLQHPNFSFDYKNQDAFQIADTLNNLVTKAENAGFDSFWVMDHFHQIPGVGKPEEPMLEGWTTISVLAGITSKIKLGINDIQSPCTHVGVNSTFLFIAHISGGVAGTNQNAARSAADP